MFPQRMITGRAIVAAILALTIGMSSFASAAKADTAGQTSTRNLILGGLVAIAAVILYDNYHHKQVQANSVVGYTPQGCAIYGSGRVTCPNGEVLYTGNSNGNQCTYDGYGVPCGQNAAVYAPTNSAYCQGMGNQAYQQYAPSQAYPAYSNYQG